MKYLGILLVLALLLVPTTAAAPAKPDESASCGVIALVIFQFGGPDHWVMGVVGATGPWMLAHGSAICSTNTYKGCPFTPCPNPVFFGPYTGDVDEQFVAPHAAMKGDWQVISATQTSNDQFVP